MTKKVFLGGICADSTWREELIPQLKISFYNPVVEDWNEEAQAEEIKQRETCDYCLYTITSEMEGVYSIAEAVDDSNKRPHKTIFCIIGEGFNDHQLKSLRQVGKMINNNGGMYFNSLEEVAKYVNDD